MNSFLLQHALIPSLYVWNQNTLEMESFYGSSLAAKPDLMDLKPFTVFIYIINMHIHTLLLYKYINVLMAKSYPDSDKGVG